MHLIKYIFFSAYWTAYDLGEKDTPYINAEYLTFLLLGLNLFGILECLMFLGLDLSNWMAVIPFLISHLIVRRVFIHKKKFNRHLNEFMFLKDKTKFKLRIWFLAGISIWSILFVAFGAYIR